MKATVSGAIENYMKPQVYYVTEFFMTYQRH